MSQRWVSFGARTLGSGRICSGRRVTWRTVPSCSVLAFICLQGCHMPVPDAPPVCAPCGAGFAADPARQRQIAEQWESIRDDVGAQADLDLGCLCFGEGESTVIEGGAIQLPADWQVSEQTARAAHLAWHRVRPPLFESSSEPCAERVRRAVEQEAKAHGLELELRAALGVKRHRYPFEAGYYATPAEQREGWLRGYFFDHPNGDGVVPGFANQYGRRCR